MKDSKKSNVIAKENVIILNPEKNKTEGKKTQAKKTSVKPSNVKKDLLKNGKVQNVEPVESELEKKFNLLLKQFAKLEAENEAIKNERTNIEAIKRRVQEIDNLKNQLNIFVASFTKISELPKPENVQDFEDVHLYLHFGEVGERDPLVKTNNKFITQEFIKFILEKLSNKIETLQKTINKLSEF